MGTDSKPGQNQCHGVSEEGQVSGKHIPDTSYTYLGIEISALGACM